MVRLVLLVGVVAVGCVSRTAGAGLMIENGGVIARPGYYLFPYVVHFSTPPGEEEIRAGDFVTVYDVGTPGPGGTFMVARASADWAVSTSLIGVDGPQTEPNDNPGLVNVTFTFGGAPVMEDVTFIYFEIESTAGGLELEDYTSQRTDAAGVDEGRKIGEIGRVFVPAIPEPASGTLVVMGAAGALLRGRGRSS